LNTQFYSIMKNLFGSAALALISLSQCGLVIASFSGAFLNASKPHHRRLVNHKHHHVERLSGSEDDLEALGAASFLTASADEAGHTVVRPTAGGEPDEIQFGLYAKNFYGADLKTNTFRMDLVLSYVWQDARVAKVVPAGLERVVLSASQAAAKVWTPMMAVTNRDMGAYNRISAEVQILKSGQVEMVERVQVKAANNFELNNYPFDVQDFRVKIASTKYMVDDLVLKPSSADGVSGINDGLVDGTSYEMQSWSTSAYEEADGNLVKSRGMLQILVSRNLEKYSQDHLVPTAISLMISWAVFYFPFATPFITPRLMLSIITLLTFTNLMIKSNKQLPGAAPFNWNDLFNQFVQTLMFLTIVLNVASEICFHQFKAEALARQINHEAKVLIPAFSITVITCILCFGSYHIMTLHHATMFTQFLVLSVCGSYAYWCMVRLKAENVANTPRKDAGGV